MADLAGAVAKSMATHARKPHDLYPTPYEATHALVPLLNLESGATIGEPACGDGAISRVLEAHGFEVVSSDLRQTGFGHGGYNYLGVNDEFGSETSFTGSMGWMAEYGLLDAIVTNPPFSLAEAFIRKAVVQAPVVAMLLKSDFWNAAKRLKLWDECTPTAHHPMTWRLAFLKEERGNNPIMNCDWWIWDNRQPKLPCRPLAKPSGVNLPLVAEAGILTKLAAATEAREADTALWL